MTYSKTYIGLILAILGWVGVANLVTEGEVATIVDGVIQIAGILFAAYGRYKAGGVNLFGLKG